MADPVALLGSTFERVLVRRGATNSQARRRRVEVREGLEARAAALRHRRTLWRGHRVVAVGPGRIEFRPFDVAGAGAGQLTVAVDESSISPGTERAQWLRLPNAQPAFPYTPGYSSVGHVLDVDADAVATIRRGDRVALLRLGHQSVATTSISSAVAIPRGVSDGAASLTYLAVIAGHGLDCAGPIDGRRVAVIGQGTIGALVMRLASGRAPASLVGVAATRRREDETLSHGATSFITVDADPGSVEADVVIDATGDPQALAWAVEATASGGTVVLLGSPRGAADLPVATVCDRSLQVVGAHISALPAIARRTGRNLFQTLANDYVTQVASGIIDVDDLLGPCFDPRELTVAYRQLVARDIAAARLDWRRLDDDVRHRRMRPISLPVAPSFVQQPEIATPTPTTTLVARVTEHGSVRFAVIGCGDIGMADATAIDAAPGAEVVVCCDVVAESARVVADSIGSRYTDSLDSAFDPAVVDAVLLSTPHDQHEPLAARAAAAGLHVVVEKPLAHDLESARRMAATADRASTALSVCFPSRYLDEIIAVRRLLDADAIGPLRGASVVFHADKPDAYWRGGFSGRTSSDWRRQVDRSGGGVLIMNLTHYIDLLLCITGAQPATVHAVRQGSRHEGIEDGIAVSFSLDNGVVGSMVGHASTRGAPPNVFRVWGDHGTIELEPTQAVFSERALDGTAPGRWKPLEVGDETVARRRFFEQFASAILEGRMPDVSLDDALAVQVFVDAAYRSARSNEDAHESSTIVRSPQ